MSRNIITVRYRAGKKNNPDRVFSNHVRDFQNVQYSYLLPDEELFELLFLDEEFELPDERLGAAFVELPDERLGAAFVELPDERLGAAFVEPPDERPDVVEDGFLVPVLVDGFVVTVELLEGVEPVTLLPDCRVTVPLELLDGILDEFRELPTDDGRVELAELLDGTDTGRA
jgi:hypothetical protein